jgi:hypothetical protein
MLGLHLVGQYIEFLLLLGGEVQLAGGLLDHLGAHLGHALGVHGATLMGAASAGREATDDHGDAGEDGERAFDPGFHDISLSSGLNMTAWCPRRLPVWCRAGFGFFQFVSAPVPLHALGLWGPAGMC